MERLLLCANPAASGFTGGLHRAVLSRLRRHFDVESEWPKSTQEARALSAAAKAEGFDLVIAMGGDGVAHHVANGLGGSGVPLGIIPVGTTNVWARLLGLPSRAIAATDFICTRPTAIPAPAALLDLDFGNGKTESSIATFACGIGFDAAVVERAEQEPYRKYRLGALHYASSAAGVAWSRYAKREPDLVVEAQGQSVSGVAVFVRLYDCYTYFGRVPVRYGGHVPDTLGVLIARSINHRQIPSVLWRAATGQDLSKVAGFEAWTEISSVQVKVTSGAIPAQADGEILGSPLGLSITARPRHLRVLMPGRKQTRRWNTVFDR